MEPIDTTPKYISSLLVEAYSCRTYDLNRSIFLAKKAIKLSKTIGDNSLIGESLNQLSLFLMINGSYIKAIKLSKEAIHYFEILNDEKGIADAKYNIAGVYYKTDNYHLGLINLIDCLNIYRKYNDYHNEARSHKSLGTIYEYFGDQKNAVLSYNSAIEAAKKIKDINLLTNAYNPLSGIYLKQNKVSQALRLIEKSIVLKTKTGDIRGLAFALYGRGKVYAKQELHSLAEADYKRAIEIHISAGERLGLGMAYHKLGSLYKQIGQFQEAKATLQLALAVSQEFNIVIIKFKSNYLLYQIAKLEGDTATALDYLELYLSQKEGVINTQSLQIIENYELITKMQNLEKEAQLQNEKAEMVEKKERAEQSARIKQDFLSTMSHEIRTPLNAVTTITSLLSEKYNGADQELITSLKAASRNLLMVINDILDFTKLDSGRVAIELRPCELQSVLRRICTTYESLATEKGLKLEMEFGESLHVCYSLDETKISQILGNLITNAIKFTEVGTVTLNVQKILATPDKDTIRFKVIDTGIGIPLDYYQEMFESFSQPKSITTRKQGGTGLGLAIVKKLVEICGSQICFESKVNEGSSFFFDLELSRTTVVNSEESALQDKLKNKTVLLVEDNMINAMVAKRLLGNWGITTEHALNGILGIEKAMKRSYDFVLMDIHMPEMNGLDATSYLRTNENLNRTTPIFALTADITAESQTEYTSFFDGFLRKPIEIEKLYEALTLAQPRTY